MVKTTVYNFKPEFAEAIRLGRKTQTIRAPRKKPGHVGVGGRMGLYTGLRTKNCRLIGYVFCIDVYDVYMERSRVLGPGGVYYDKQWFADQDGFEDWNHMRAFFEEQHGLPFEGHLIRWIGVPQKAERKGT